jgi:hypothetical protein
MSGNIADGLLLDVRELDLTDLELAESEIKLPSRPAYIWSNRPSFAPARNSRHSSRLRESTT